MKTASKVNNAGEKVESSGQKEKGTPSHNNKPVQKVGLTPLWEQVTRLGHIPAETDVTLVFYEISARLRHGEWEVRQHALRVLTDVVPVLGHHRLEICLPSVLSELITNLGHPSAAVRKGASNTLRACIRESDSPDGVLRTVIARANSDDRNVALGVVIHLPLLLDDRVSMQTMSIMIGTIAKKLIQISFQEHALKSLVKIRQTIGERDFNHILAKCSPQCLQDFSILCQVYEVSDYTSNPLDLSEPLGFLSDDQPEFKEFREFREYSSDDTASDPSRNPWSSQRAPSPSPTRAAPSSAVQRPSQNSAVQRPAQNSAVQRPAPSSSSSSAERPISGRSSSMDNPKSRSGSGVGSGASSSFSQPSSDYEEDGMFIRGKSASSQRSRVGTGRRVRFGGESELKTPSPIVIMNDDTVKENVSPAFRRKSILEVEKQPPVSHIPVRVKTDNGPSVNPVRPRSRSQEHPLSARSNSIENQQIEVPPRPEIRVSSPTIMEQQYKPMPPIESQKQTALTSKNVQNSPPSSSPQKSPSKKPMPKRKKNNSRGRESPIPTFDGGESLTASSSDYEREEAAKARQAPSAAEDASRVASALASLDEIQKKAAENASWEDLSIVDKSVMEDLRDRDDWRARVRGAQQLKAALRNSGAVERLRAHLPEFLTFLDSMLEDHSPLVVSATLGTFARLAEALGNKLGPHVRHICGSLCRPAASSRAEVKMEAAHAAKALMQVLGPQMVMEALAENVKARNHRHREASLQLVILGLLTFPSSDFDAIEIAKIVMPSLADGKRRVRQAALECTAVLGQFIHTSALPIHLADEKLRTKQSIDALHSAVNGRLARKILPVLSSEGLILYSVQVSNAAARGLSGADVEWILAGSGSTSAGSARSRGQLFSAARRASSEDSLPEDTRPISSNRQKSSKGSRSPSRKRVNNQLTSPVKEYQSFQMEGPPPNSPPPKVEMPEPKNVNTDNVNTDVPDDTWELVPVAALKDDQNNSRLPTEGPLWTAELATDPNQPPDGQNRPMYLRLLRRQPEQLVNLDKERGYILLPSKQLASALGRSPAEASASPNQSQPSNNMPPSPAFHQTRSHQERVYESRGNMEHQEERFSPTRVSVSNNYANPRERHRMSPLTREQLGSPPSTASSSDNGYGSPYHRHGSMRGRMKDKKERNLTEPGPSGLNKRGESPKREERGVATNQSSPSKRSPVNNNVLSNNNNNFHQTQSAPGAIPYDHAAYTLDNVPEVENKQESRRSSAHSSVARSGDSAIGSIGSAQTPPTAQYFDPFETPLPYSTRNLAGPYFNQDSFTAPASPQRNQPPQQEVAPKATPVASPAPPASVHSSPRRSLAPSPERSNSPPIRPQASSPIPLHQQHLQAAQANYQNAQQEFENPAERPLPQPVELTEQPMAPVEAVAFAVPMVPKSRPPRSVSTHIPRRAVKSSNLNRGVRNSSAHSSSSSLMDDIPPTPFRRPHDVFNTCKIQLDSADWMTINKALKTLNYLVEHHSDVIAIEIHSTVASVVTQIKNLRSQVSRTACQVAGNMAIHMKRTLENEVEELVAPLLHRSADTTKFHRTDCNAALDKIMQNVSPMKTLPAVISQGASHKNAVVRTTTARLLCDQVNRMGAEKVMNYISKDVRVKLLRTIANLLTEGSQETRDWAKKAMQPLVHHDLFDGYLEQAVSPSILRAIDKTLKVLKGRVPQKK
ncbi:uncharacterized protein LOC132196481 isoform X2 [Neocloeon triangulifer]|uniref:uncharacterized protein LOC132196481 isoform X2 n=1 Tax=Neocloeon triangulifer TaxID=2078957 RepID=UPI00286F2CB8|nr:uncharacterized protein LOC132196481 isoform X2 [Neocloeon triangulifer]